MTTRHQQPEQQNPRKRLASDQIRQKSQSSQSDKDLNVEIPAEKP